MQSGKIQTEKRQKDKDREREWWKHIRREEKEKGAREKRRK
jgi:hypothetical protein